MAIDLIQWMVFCRWRHFLAAWAMSIAVQGSVGLAPRLRNSEPSGSSTRAAAAVQASVHCRYSARGRLSSYERYSMPRLYGGDVTMTETESEGSEAKTSRQSAW